MKSLIAVALCATALSSAAPALAQGHDRPGGGGPVQPGHGFREQLDALDGRVQEGIRTGQIDRGEADRATRELGSIRAEMQRLRSAAGELSDIDRGRLQERLDTLSRSIHWMREHGPAGGPGAPPPSVVVMPPTGYGQAGAWSLERREDWLQQRINQGRTDGSLTRREAYRIQMGLNDVKKEQARLMRRGRLRDADRESLEQRLDHLRESVRWARHNDEQTPPWRR